MKLLSSKKIVLGICFLFAGQNFLLAEAGDFVKDIKIPDFEIRIPEIQKESIGSSVDFYKLKSDELPVCNLEIHLYGGESSVGNLPIEVVPILAGSLKYGGTKQFADEVFLAKLENLGAKFEIETDYRKMKIELSFLKKDQEEVLNLISDLFRNPAFTENSISNAKRKMTEQIRRRNDSTDSVVFRKTKELLFRGLTAGKSYQIDTLEKIQKENLSDFYLDMIRNGKKVILASGSFDENKLKNSISNIFPSKAAGNPKFKQEVIDEDILHKNFEKFPYKNILIDKQVNQSAILMTGFLPRHNHPDFYAIQVLNYIIGGGGFNSYFMQEIRSDRGLAYSASSYPVFRKDHGFIYFYVQTKNETTMQVYGLMKEILSEKRFEKITDKEIQNAKNAIQNQFVFLFSNNPQILSSYLRFSEDEMPRNYLKDYKREIGKITLEDLKRVGKKYFASRNLKTILVGPRESQKFLESQESKTITVESSL